MSSQLPTLDKTPTRLHDGESSPDATELDKTQLDKEGYLAGVDSEENANALEERSHAFPWRYKGPALLCVLCFTRKPANSYICWRILLTCVNTASWLKLG